MSVVDKTDYNYGPNDFPIIYDWKWLGTLRILTG